jgi:hypothetical protein
VDIIDKKWKGSKKIKFPMNGMNGMNGLPVLKNELLQSSRRKENQFKVKKDN